MPEFAPQKSVMPYNLTLFQQAYLDCVEWLECSEDREEENPSISDARWSPDFIEGSIADCEDFVNANGSLLDQAYANDIPYDETRAGHDFWLTRCGHGTGFWDRGLGDIGDKLSEAAAAFENVDIYLGDDGLIYGS